MNDNWKYDVFYLQELMQEIYRDVNGSYEVLQNYDGNQKYQMALNFMGMSYHSYLTARQFYHNNHKVERGEFEDFFKAYENFKYQMSEVIINKDKNTSWLFSRLEQFNTSMKEINNLIENIKPKNTR